MYKVVKISYSRDGQKIFTILDTSDNVKENLTIAQVQKARILGLKIENLPKYELYPFKTEKDLCSYWNGYNPDYILSISNMIKKEANNIHFPGVVRIYVFDWTKSLWFDCGIPKYLQVRCDSVIELISHWLFFCSNSFISFDSVDRIEQIERF